MNSPFDLYRVAEFFDLRTCGEMIRQMRRVSSSGATLYGRGESASVDERMRRVTRLAPSPETARFVERALHERREEIGRHFGIALGELEEAQFLRYRTGDFFVAHQDGNTGMTLLDKQQARRVSIVIFLNGQSETPEADKFCGGSLVFSDWRVNEDKREFPFAGEAGTLVAFRSETTHEVTAVTGGERFTIISWFKEG